MSLKCHFDADGWLQGPIRITHMTSPNHFPSGFAVRARGMVQHTEDGFEAGTVATFLNPAAQVSAFFSADELGNAHQYLPVGRGLVAWAEAGGNPEWYSCEFEDRLNPGSPMTQPQMVTGAQILEALSERDGFPLQLTSDTVNGRGLITHGAGGAAWGNHPNCPGPVRKAQGAHLVALALSIRQDAESAPKTWRSAGQLPLHDLAATHLHAGVAATLALTARSSPGAVFAPDLARYVDTVFAGDSTKCPAGVTWHYPGKADQAMTWITKGDLSLSALAAQLGTKPSAVLQVTADVAGTQPFQQLAASYIDGVFARSALHVPAGVVLMYGAS